MRHLVIGTSALRCEMKRRRAFTCRIKCNAHLIAMKETSREHCRWRSSATIEVMMVIHIFVSVLEVVESSWNRGRLAYNSTNSANLDAGVYGLRKLWADNRRTLTHAYSHTFAMLPIMDFWRINLQKCVKKNFLTKNFLNDVIGYFAGTICATGWSKEWITRGNIMQRSLAPCSICCQSLIVRLSWAVFWFAAIKCYWR